VPPSGLAQSLATLRRAAAMMARDAAADGQMLAIAHEYIGRRLTAMGQYTEAIAEHGVALSTAEKILAKHPEDQPSQQRVLEANLGITRAWTLAGKRELALQCAMNLINRLERDAFPPSAIADGYLSLGAAHRAFEEWGPALAAAQETLRRNPSTRTQRDARALLAECRFRARVSAEAPEK
jgi:tetratricopeptide (TPR) repeat protein